MACYGVALALIGWAAAIEGLWPGIAVGLMLAAGVAGYHYHLDPRSRPDGCFRAFNHNTWFGAAILVGIGVGLLLER